MPDLDLSRRAVTLGLGCTALSACASGAADTDATVTPTWRTGTDMPLAVQEIYPCLYPGAGGIVVGGGFVANNGRITGPTDAQYVFKTSDQTWQRIANLPTARHHPHLVSLGMDMAVLGGFESPSAEAVWQMKTTGWVLNGAVLSTPLLSDETNAYSEVWRPLPELPAPCGEAVTARVGDAIHLAGGRTPSGLSNASWNDHTDTGHHFVLSDVGGSWETAAPLPTPRNSAAAGLIGRNWHVVGGRTVGGGNNATHEIYDTREDRWRSAAPMPQAQGGLAAAVANDKLYVFGGEFFDNGGGVYPESWIYDPARDAWDQLPDMPRPRHGLGAVAVDREIHVIGGALKAGGNDTSAVVDILTVA